MGFGGGRWGVVGGAGKKGGVERKFLLWGGWDIKWG